MLREGRASLGRQMPGRGWAELGCRRAGGANSWRGVVVARGGLGAACPREEKPAGMPGGARAGSRVHFAVDVPWTRSTGGVRSPVERERRERDRLSGSLVNISKF